MNGRWSVCRSAERNGDGDPALDADRLDLLQVRAGGDAAALKGIAKALLQLEEEQGNVLDHAFIAQHTQGFTAFADDLHATRWQDIEQESGLTRESLTQGCGGLRQIQGHHRHLRYGHHPA